MSKLNNQEDTSVHEVTYILKRKITRQNKKITGVSRSFEVNGETIYSDNISREVFRNCCDQPDIFRLVELFSMGENAPIKLPPSEKDTMSDSDEELRKFCLEQAVSLFIHAERARGLMSFGKSKSIFELSDAIIDYIKNGREAEIPGFFSKNTI